MFDLSVVAQGGLWLLLDDIEGELGAYDSQAAALEAAGRYALIDDEARHVLILEEEGDWEETLIEPPPCH